MHTQQALPARFKLGDGFAECSRFDGSLCRIEHPAHESMSFLLTEKEVEWHHAPYFWGKGFVITDKGAARWDHPAELRIDADGISMRHVMSPQLTLEITRRFGGTCSEKYSFVNTSTEPLSLRSLAISTPFRDVYPSARESLTGACHAHLWTGGAFSWVWATPMHGRGPGLGLWLRSGELWSYSIETRNQWTSSNARGHIYLHATDVARAPHAMGGQPEIVIPAGHSWELSWELGWFADFDDFQRQALNAPFTMTKLAETHGAYLEIATTSPETKIVALNGARAQAAEEGRWKITTETSGVKHIDIIDGTRVSRTAVLFHHPLRQIVENRIAFILSHQRAHERESNRQGAFLPFDTRWGLRINAGNWSDWSDGRERLAMPVLMQMARMRGWGDAAAIDQALDKFDLYCRMHLVDTSGNVYEDSYHRRAHRLYNFPWVAEFIINQWILKRRREDLLLAFSILDRYYEAGGDHFLAFIFQCAEKIHSELILANQTEQASRLGAHLVQHADRFVGLGIDMPNHEVNYEQSIVAPLVLLLEIAYKINPNQHYADALRERMRWMLAFAGKQPHVRLRHIGIRHWDGYWFGGRRMWGDIMPHYWSCQNALALLRWPAELGEIEHGRTMAREILQANLAHFHDDGSATCAFVFPGCVDGNPGYDEDPVINDQDWALVYSLYHPELVAL